MGIKSYRAMKDLSKKGELTAIQSKYRTPTTTKYRSRAPQNLMTGICYLLICDFVPISGSFNKQQRNMRNIIYK